MTVYDFPTTWYREVSGSFVLRASSQTASHPWRGTRSVYGPHSQMWVCKMTFASEHREFWQPMGAFFSRLRGQANLIRIGHYARNRPQYDIEAIRSTSRFSDLTMFSDGTGFEDGLLPPTVFVAGAAARGARAMLIGGLPASMPRVLRRGDLLEIRRNGIADETPSLHEVMVDGPTNSSGVTGVEIEPPLRKGIAIGDQVSLRWPSSIFRLVDDGQAEQEIEVPVTRASFGFSLVEALV